MDYRELENFSYEGIPLGKLVQISTRWFLAANDISASKQNLSIYRNFVISAIIVSNAAKNLLETIKPNVVFLLNGLFFEERIVCSWAERMLIPVVTYENGFIRNSFIFARNSVACYYDLSNHWPSVKNKPLSQEENQWLDKYLADRQIGNRAVIQYWPKREERIAEIKKKLCLDSGKKIVVAFTNIIWDSAVQDRDIAFEGMFSWLRQIIVFFSKHSECQFIVRIHPAEIRLKGRETTESAARFIRATFSELQSNIHIIPPDSKISSYRLIELSDLILTYTSTIGLEAALMGKIVQVAGQTHYREKGFTIDTESRDEYFDRLGSLLKNGNNENIVNTELARRYAYLFFKKYMIDFSSIIQQEKSSKINLVTRDLTDLQINPPAELSALVDFILQTKLGDQSSLIL